MNTKPHSANSKTIGIWLMIGVIMIIIQIVLGGITRLTGSGLSITEWKPILGTIPPLNDREWQQAFGKYQEIAQFKKLNSHFSLDDFKFIFFWEWFHRVWGRLIGLVFIVPFVVFLFRGMIKKDSLTPLLILFALGGLQGLIGWIMVKSGLNETSLYVNHIKLAIHFIAAIILLIFNFWLALKFLSPQSAQPYKNKSGTLILSIIILLNIQLAYGAFMAGLKAGVYAPTWPDINGSLIFPAINNLTVSSFFNDPIGVHFVHRNLAYLISALILVWTYKAQKDALSRNKPRKFFPLIFLIAQIILGVYATLTSYKAIPQGWGTFEWTAQLHQLVAIFLLLSLVYNLYTRKPLAKIHS